MDKTSLGGPVFRLSARIRRVPALAFGIALAAFIAALLIRFAVNTVLPAGFPYLTFFPAVLLTAFFCGTGPGIMVAGLSVLSAWYWFIAPFNSFALDLQSAVAVLFFVVILAADLLMIHIMHSAVERLENARSRTAELLERQRTLFEELQHRTANNMAFVGALLAMHKRRSSRYPEAVAALDDAASRLDSMARIHRRLYDPTNIDLPIGSYFEALVRDVLDSAGRGDVTIRAQSDVERLDVNRLLTLSLVVSELAVNAAKHAFPDGTGTFEVSLTRRGERLLLVVRDDGPGLPEGFGAPGGDRLGFRVLSSFARTLDGTFSFRSDGGAVTELDFPAATGG